MTRTPLISDERLQAFVSDSWTVLLDGKIIGLFRTYSDARVMTQSYRELGHDSDSMRILPPQ